MVCPYDLRPQAVSELGPKWVAGENQTVGGAGKGLWRLRQRTQCRQRRPQSFRRVSPVSGGRGEYSEQVTLQRDTARRVGQGWRVCRFPVTTRSIKDGNSSSASFWTCKKRWERKRWRWFEQTLKAVFKQRTTLSYKDKIYTDHSGCPWRRVNLWFQERAGTQRELLLQSKNRDRPAWEHTASSSVSKKLHWTRFLRPSLM